MHKDSLNFKYIMFIFKNGPKNLGSFWQLVKTNDSLSELNYLENFNFDFEALLR